MCKNVIKPGVCQFFKGDWTLFEKILVVICGASVGIIIGFLISPIKYGIGFGCGNGSNNIEGTPKQCEKKKSK